MTGPKDISGKIDIYKQILLSEKKVRNIVGSADESDLLSSHIIPCIGLCGIIRGGYGIDIGSGNGLPGVVAAASCPEKEIVLLDSSAKRINFLKKVKRECRLDNIIPVRGRAERTAHLEEYREKFEFALSRALAPLKIACELAMGFIKVGGYYYVMSGGHCREEVASASEIIAKLGASVEKITPEGIIIIRKNKKLSAEYPRKWSKIK